MKGLSQAHRFRYGLLIFDIATLGFIVATSFIRGELDWGGGCSVWPNNSRRLNRASDNKRPPPTRTAPSRNLGRRRSNRIVLGAAGGRARRFLRSSERCASCKALNSLRGSEQIFRTSGATKPSF